MFASKKESSSRRRLRTRERKRRIVTVLMVVFSSLAVWGVSLYLGQLGPEKVVPWPPKDSSGSAKVEKLLGERDQQMTAEQLKDLSVGLEMEAKALKNAEDYEAAAVKYERAFDLQETINKDHPSSLQSDRSRAIRLMREAQDALAEPLFLESLRLEQDADSFSEADDTDSAAELLNEAIVLQQQLNGKYRNARRASTLRLRQLKSKLAELESGKFYAEIENILEHATALQEAGKMGESGELFEEAALLQSQLNDDFPDSPHASADRFDYLQKQGQIGQSALFAEEIYKKSALLEQLLSEQRPYDAERLLVELKQELDAFEEAFPLSSLIDELLRGKLEYLYEKKADLAAIQDQINNALLPVTGMENIYMLKTEVPQSLYVLLIGTNPSRNRADSKPVDSISWIEAMALCERLSWILGKEVRLPTEAEFRQAMKGFDSSNAADSIWNVLNAKGSSQPVGQKKPLPDGYFDLLGNVSEWLLSDGSKDSKTAFHIGGHVQDSLDVISSVPVRKLQKTERNRLTGFRVVVVGGLAGSNASN